MKQVRGSGGLQSIQINKLPVDLTNVVLIGRHDAWSTGGFGVIWSFNV